MTNNTTGTAPERPTLAQLSDAISEVKWIAEATDQLVQDVSRNIFAFRQIKPDLNFGPMDGLNWLLGELMGHIHDAEAMAESLLEPQP